MPHAKFHADLLKTVAVHKEQRNRHTHIQFYIYKI